MTPDQITTAIVNAIIQGGRQWVVSTIAAMLPSLWAITVILHLARPYVFRTIRKLSLRFGADVWWLSYVLVRDGMVLTTFALSLVFLFPNLDMTIPLPLTAPLAGALLFASLYVKLLYDSDDDLQTYRVSTVLLAVAVAFYLVPQIFAIETTSQGWLSGVSQFLTTTTNTAWVGPIVITAMVAYGVIGGLIFQQVVVRGSRFGERREITEAANVA
ncbi:MAG TPA: hypothetical protein VFL27_01415 [Candidatus Dormibacteraeota bacterium]|nr:hypothetical protein [Candidatus Dormibacteraeota bacterium]